MPRGSAIVQGRELDLQTLSQVADLTHDAVLRTRLNGKIIYWGRNAQERYGWTAQEATGKNSHELLKTRFPVPLEDVKWSVLRDGVWEGELRHTTREGRQVAVITRLHLERNRKGQPSAILQVDQPASAHRAGTEPGSREEQRIHFALLVSGVGVWEWNLSNNSVYYSPEWKRMLGFADDEISDSHVEWESRLHPEDRHRVIGELHTYIERPGTLCEIDYRLAHKDGSYRHILTRATVWSNAQGRPEHMVGADLDITKRVKAETRLRRLVDSNMLAVAYWQYDGKVTDANDAYLKLIGYSREDLLAGRIDWRKLTPAEYLPLNEKAFEEVAREGVSRPFEKEYIRRDGTRVPILVGHASLDGETGIAYALDISALKKAEKALEEQQATIRALSIPMLPLAPGLLVMPLIGVLDLQRITQVTDQLLRRIRADRLKAVVLDMTGLTYVDYSVADRLMKTVDSARLLGARIILTGISRVISQTLVDKGVDWVQLQTAADLQSGFEDARALLER